MFGTEISVPSLCNFPPKYVSLLEICTPSGNLYPQNIYSCKKFVQALLALVEASFAGSARLLLSAAATPSHTRFALADLRSRLSAATLYRLRELDDGSRAKALRRYAGRRGIEIPDVVVGYVLSRHRRDMPSLIALLDRLDYHSRAQQHRLTVPFVRGLIEAG